MGKQNQKPQRPMRATTRLLNRIFADRIMNGRRQSIINPWGQLFWAPRGYIPPPAIRPGNNGSGNGNGHGHGHGSDDEDRPDGLDQGGEAGMAEMFDVGPDGRAEQTSLNERLTRDMAGALDLIAEEGSSDGQDEEPANSCTDVVDTSRRSDSDSAFDLRPDYSTPATSATTNSGFSSPLPSPNGLRRSPRNRTFAEAASGLPVSPAELDASFENKRSLENKASIKRSFKKRGSKPKVDKRSNGGNWNSRNHGMAPKR